MDEQIAYYEGLLAPYYNLETGEPLLDGLDPFPDDIVIYQSLIQARAEGVELTI